MLAPHHAVDNSHSQSQAIPQQRPEYITRLFNDEATKDFIYCWIEGDTIDNNDDTILFNFKLDLWLRNKSEPIEFYANYKTVNKLLSYIRDEKIYSATQNFPQC